MKSTFLLGSLVALAMAGCASTTKQADTMLMTEAELHNSGAQVLKDADGYWSAVKRVSPRYPLKQVQNGVSGCVELEYRIGSDGKMDGYRVVRAFPGDVFVDAVVDAMKQTRWQPTAENTAREPVVTTIQLDLWLEGFETSGYRENCGG